MREKFKNYIDLIRTLQNLNVMECYTEREPEVLTEMTCDFKKH